MTLSELAQARAPPCATFPSRHRRISSRARPSGKRKKSYVAARSMRSTRVPAVEAGQRAMTSEKGRFFRDRRPNRSKHWLSSAGLQTRVSPFGRGERQQRACRATFATVRFVVTGPDASFRAFGFDLRPRASAAATAGARARSSWRSNASVVAPRASMFLLNALLLSAFDASSLALLSAGSTRLCAASGAAVRHSAAIAPTTPGSHSRALAMRIAAKSSTKKSAIRCASGTVSLQATRPKSS